MKKNLLSISIIRKVIVSLTGLFLCTFLFVHLLGNLQLLLPKEIGKKMFNEYSGFMAENTFIQVTSKVTMLFFVLHSFYGLFLAYKNMKARPVKYSYGNKSRTKKWASIYMTYLGLALLLFLILHLNTFWAKMKFGSVPLDEFGNKDLYTLTVSSFQNIYYVCIYVVSMIILGYHLYHGFESSFQSIGANRFSGLAKVVRVVGVYFSLIVSGLFALIPIILYFYK